MVKLNNKKITQNRKKMWKKFNLKNIKNKKHRLIRKKNYQKVRS